MASRVDRIEITRIYHLQLRPKTTVNLENTSERVYSNVSKISTQATKKKTGMKEC